MYSYLHEQISESALTSRMAELAGEGWRLISVVINPLTTSEASPLYITFWERPV